MTTCVMTRLSETRCNAKDRQEQCVQRELEDGPECTHHNSDHAQ